MIRLSASNFLLFSCFLALAGLSACTNQTAGGVYSGCENLFPLGGVRRTACMFGVDKARDCFSQYHRENQVGIDASTSPWVERCAHSDCRTYSDSSSGTATDSRLRQVLNASQNEGDCKDGVRFCLADLGQCDRH